MGQLHSFMRQVRTHPKSRPLAKLGALLTALSLTTGGLGSAFLFTLPTPAADAQTPSITIRKKTDAVASTYNRNMIRVLVMGSDVRKDESVGGQRADAIHVVSYNREAKRGSIINIPRDSYVEIAGKRGKQRINAALELGGIETQIETIEDLIGFKIDYWAMTDFDGLIGLVNDIGGVTVDVPKEMNDKASGANFKKGPTWMSGDDALAFSRNRHFETGDFERTEHQAILLLAILKELQQKAEWRPDIFKYMEIMEKHVDHNLTATEMFELGLVAFQADASNIQNYTMKGGTSTIGGASVVILSGNESALKEIEKNGYMKG